MKDVCDQTPITRESRLGLPRTMKANAALMFVVSGIGLAAIAATWLRRNPHHRRAAET